MITTVDEFFDTFVRDGVYDRDAGIAALQELRNHDRKAFFDLMTSPEFVTRCIALQRQYPELWGPSTADPAEMTEEQMEEVDALIDEAEELEERAAQLRAQADALRDIYEYGEPDVYN